MQHTNVPSQSGSRSAAKWESGDAVGPGGSLGGSFYLGTYFRHL